MPSAQNTNVTSVTFRAIFSEAVTGVDATDFTATVVSGSLTSSISGIAVIGTTGTTYDVTVSSVTGNGTLRLDLKDAGTSIADVVGNAIIGGYTSGQTYSINVGFTSVTDLSSISVTANTGEKPQGKVWTYSEDIGLF